MARTPDQVADKWMRRTQGATQDYIEGVQAVEVAPGIKAAEQADHWERQTIAAKSRFKENVKKVTLSSWQDSAVSKGAGRISEGVSQAMTHMPATFAKLAAAQKTVSTEVDQTPRGSFEQNMQRMVKQATGMHKFKGKISAKHG